MTEADLAELQARLARSERIIDALIERVERATDFHATDSDGTNYRNTAFSVFETAVAWDWRVRARTADQHRAMTELAHAMADLEHVNAKLQREIRERAAAEAALLDAKLLADQHNAEKTRFLAAVSHDLIQPLNAARLFVGALGNHRLPEPSRALVGQTSSALDSVEDILEALLEIAQLDAGAVQPSIEAIDLDALLQHLGDEFALVAQERGLALTIVSDGITVSSDALLLRRILQNLISNALRYTHRGGVEVVALRRRRDVAIEVRDTGPGIARKDREFIFREFSRLKRGQSAGAGLGLAIVERATRTLGHRLTLTSRIGRGSTFRLLVPAARIAVRAEAAPRIARGPLVGFRALVIENEAASREALAALLAGWGCAVDVAAGEHDAACLCRQGRLPDIIVADYHLDDGLTSDRLIEGLKARHGLSCPVIIVTADRDRPLLGGLADRGYAVLTKPVRADRLHGLIRRLLRG